MIDLVTKLPFARLVGAVFIIQSIGFLALYLQHVFLARLLSEADYGSYIFATNSAQILALIGGMGFSLSALKFVAEYHATGNYQLVRGFIRFGTRRVVGFSLLITWLALGAFLLFPPNDIDQSVIIVGLWLAPLIALETFGASIMRGLKQIVQSQFPVQIVRPIVIVFVTILLVGVANWQGSFAGIGGFAAAVIVSIGIEVTFVWPMIRGYTTAEEGANEHRAWFSNSFFQWVEVSLISLGDRGPLIIIGFLLGAEEVALFAIVTRLADIVFFMNYSANQVFTPMIAPLYRANDTEQLQRIIYAAARFSFFGAVGISAVILIGADFILGVFGEAYTGRDSIILMAVLMLGRILNALTGLGSYILAMTKHERDLVVIRSLSVGTSLAFIVLAIPQLGLLGAAIGKAGAVIISDIMIYLRIRQQLGLQAFIARIG